MDIHIPTLTNLQLQEISRQQAREISEIITDAITQYVEAHTHESAFRQRVREAMVQHQWLLDELDKQ